MKGDRGLLSAVYTPASKYVPSPQSKQLILNYFKYNNFQDFNTWQQIAKAKIDYEYEELAKMFTCSLTLRWEDRITPHVRAKATANSKKNAKRRALAEMVEALICQGYIARGFKEENFVERLPRRRKNESDDSGDEPEQQQFAGRGQILRMLENGQSQQVMSLLSKEKPGKQLVLYECWNYGLRVKSTGLLGTILRALSGAVEWGIQTEELTFQANNRQLFERSEVKRPLPEDLTDFISSYQLQQPLKLSIVRQPKLHLRLLPSENVLIKAFTHSPTRDQLLQYFHPIEATSLLLHGQEATPSSFLGEFERVELPSFQREETQVSVRLIELMHSLLLFHAEDLEFCLTVLALLEKHLATVSISFPRRLPYSSRQSAQLYYLKHKHLLTAQFTELLSQRIKNYQTQTSIEGMLCPIPSEDHFYQFKPMEPEDVFLRKLKRTNLSEFEEAQQISLRQMVILVSKIEGKWQGEVVELSPIIRLHVPALAGTLSDPHPVTLFRLCNAKLFQKTSSALIEASSNYLNLISERTFLLWQPPGYPQLSVIAQLLLQWQNSKQSVLLVTRHSQELAAELISLGFKVAKLASKTEEKTIAKTSIVVAAAEQVCCDLLRNYAFTRVLVQSANLIPEVSLLTSIVKDCQQLWLLGDPYLPRMHMASEYCQRRNMNMSLFERLYNQGKPTSTYESMVESSLLHSNVLGWADQYVYGKKLKLLGSGSQLPMVKGFPWPSYEHRLCFLHETAFEPKMSYFHRMAQICSLIVEQVIRSGYTKHEQIGCLASSLDMLPLLKWHIAKMLPRTEVVDLRMLNKLLGKMVRLVSGSRFAMSEMVVLLVGSAGAGLRDLLGSLLEGRRGVVLIGDCHVLCKDPVWASFLAWCKSNKLLMSCQGALSDRTVV